MTSSYLRCGHCRGFYELARSHCRYCGKDVPMKGADGQEKVFLDRETCRAIQIAEFEQLPKEAHDDCFRPDPELLDKLCYCLHCGEAGGTFEAIEMRWMENEQMWACPCTTCGGRGFTFDIHLAEEMWQCAECKHWYEAANGDKRASNAKCPKCGSTMANGWFDDEYEEDEERGAETVDLEPGALPLGIELPPMDGMKPTDAVEFVEFEAGDDAEEESDDFWRPEPELNRVEQLPDDIDFPHKRRDDDPGKTLKDDDIPY
jgi:hypothetical protein